MANRTTAICKPVQRQANFVPFRLWTVRSRRLKLKMRTLTGTWQPKFSKDTRGPIASSPVLSEDATWQLAPQVECRLALSSDVPVGSARGECARLESASVTTPL